MIYGREYGGPARCQHCDSRTAGIFGGCYFCGAARCNDCAGVIENDDPSTGYRGEELIYRGEELICNACAAKATKDIVCECCLQDRGDVLTYRAEYPTAVCCGKPGILVQSERRSIIGEGQDVA